jgi:hypothetical protein
MIENKGIYFRKVGVVADDDDSTDSFCWPAQNLKGVAHSTTGSLVAFYFKPSHDGNNHPDSGSGQLDVVYVAAANDLRGNQIINYFFQELQTGSSPIIVVYDEVDDSSFLSNYGLIVSSYISSIFSITTNKT